MGCIFWEEEILPPVFQEYIIGMPGSAGAGYDSLLILLQPADRYLNHQSPGPGKPNRIRLTFTIW